MWRKVVHSISGSRIEMVPAIFCKERRPIELWRRREEQIQRRREESARESEVCVRDFVRMWKIPKTM